MTRFNPKQWLDHNPTEPASCPAADTTAEQFEQLLQALETARIDLTDNYTDWFRFGTAIAACFGEAGRNYFHRLSAFSPKYDPRTCDAKYDDCLRNPNPSVGLATIFYRAKQAGILLHPANMPEQPRTDTPPKAAAQKPLSKAKINKLVAVSQYIREHFHNADDLRYDLLSRKIQIREKPAARWRDLTDKDICSITCAIAAQSGANITTADVHTVLCSDLVRNVHPLRDWLSRLPAYTPREGTPSPIDTLAAQVRTVGDHDLWRNCFRKWFVSMVAGWIYDEVVNHQVLVLVSERQGIFKTTWLEHIIPPELRTYLTKLASSRELGKDERLRTAEFGLINMDEIDSMSPRELNVLKSVITTADVNERAAYGRTKERRVRCASFCASGNNRKFLSDNTGNRRWLPFEVISIDDPWNRHEPYGDIYAEALWLIRNGFEYWFTQDETQAMATHTDDFREQTNEEELLPLYFAPADRDTPDAKFLATAEIHRVLIDYGHILRPMSLTRFGTLLRNEGFVRRCLPNGRKGFLVIQNDVNKVAEKCRNDAASLQSQLRTQTTGN